MYKTTILKIKIYFSMTHEMFIKIGHVFGHKGNFR